MFNTIQNPAFGYTPIAGGGENAFLLMDAGYLKLAPGQAHAFGGGGRETAALLLRGAVAFTWEGGHAQARRPDPFDDLPTLLHIPAGVRAQVSAAEPAELLLLATENRRPFPPRLYNPEDCLNAEAGADEWQGAARRDIRTVFDYESAPHSNLVVGEVVSHPGRWSSYPPHHHPQPELYFYRFDRPQGFGACFIGGEAFTVRHLSWAAIPGGLAHPQAAAPGYAMHYVWAIRHLEGDPWTKTRTVEAAHEWLLDPGADIRKTKQTEGSR